jgi:hypothetical protein
MVEAPSAPVRSPASSVKLSAGSETENFAYPGLTFSAATPNSAS